MASTENSAARSTEQDALAPWREYYALRRRAQLSVLALIFVLPLVTALVLAITDRLPNLPPWASMVILIGSGSAVTVLFCLPAIQWANWRCPRCGKTFAQPAGHPGSVFAVLIRFVAPSRCASCWLPCGADPTPPTETWDPID